MPGKGSEPKLSDKIVVHTPSANRRYCPVCDGSLNKGETTIASYHGLIGRMHVECVPGDDK